MALFANVRYGSAGRFEVLAWYFMRISGALLLLMAVLHLLYMHVVIGVDNITFQFIVAERWNGPMGAFWRLYDLVLLLFAMLHGANGARWIIDDFIRGRGWNLAVKSVLYLAILIVILMGAQVIFTVPLGSTAGVLGAVAAVFGA